MNNLLFVEDEMDLGNVIKQYLELTGFAVQWAKNGKVAFDIFTQDPTLFDLVVIDVSMPEMDGFELAEHINNISSTPFIFLTARSEKADRIRGLKIGADDYVLKPFDIDELVLRINNIIKRRGLLVEPEKPQTLVPNGIIDCEDIHFDKNRLTLAIKNCPEVSLTTREAELMEYLFNHDNMILKREDILMQLWGKNDYFLGRSLDVFVSRLRKYLKPSKFVSIANVYGIGFIFKTTTAINKKESTY